MSSGISAMTREYLELSVNHDIALLEEDLEVQHQLGVKMAEKVRKQEDRIHELERAVCKAVASTPAEFRAKAAVMLVREFDRSDDIDLIASLACDLLGMCSIAELGDDAQGASMEILSHGLV